MCLGTVLINVQVIPINPVFYIMNRLLYRLDGASAGKILSEQIN